MRKGLLIIDRGSREPEVREELERICSIAKTKGEYYYVNYCFLEVLPPFIEEGIKKCQENDVDLITVMPYFLYPGMKLKDSVSQCARIGKWPLSKLDKARVRCFIALALRQSPAVSVSRLWNHYPNLIRIRSAQFTPFLKFLETI